MNKKKTLCCNYCIALKITLICAELMLFLLYYVISLHGFCYVYCSLLLVQYFMQKLFLYLFKPDEIPLVVSDIKMRKRKSFSVF